MVNDDHSLLSLDFLGTVELRSQRCHVGKGAPLSGAVREEVL